MSQELIENGAVSPFSPVDFCSMRELPISLQAPHYRRLQILQAEHTLQDSRRPSPEDPKAIPSHAHLIVASCHD